MSMYSLIEYKNNFANTLRSLWQYHKHDPNDNITDPEPFRFKARITEGTSATGKAKDIETAVPLKCFSDLWRTLEVPLINS